VELSLKKDWSNDLITKIAETISKAQIKHYRIIRAIRHPVRDIDSPKHEKHIQINLVGFPLDVDACIKALQEFGEPEIYHIQSGVMLFKNWRSSTVFLKEEEP